MRTREQSLNEFSSVLDSLINAKYLFAGARIFDTLKTINSSKILSDMFEYFSDGFDFETILSDALNENEEGKYFILPQKNTDAITLVYLLLKEINNKNAQLTDLLDYFNNSKNYDNAYKTFANDVLIPFRDYTVEIGRQLIGQTTEQYTQIHEDTEELSNEEIKVENVTEKVAVGVNSSTTLIRLLDLDRLSIKQSRQKDEEKEELLYVLDIFAQEIKGGDHARIRLSYLAYYYALRPFRKVKNNLKEITEILMENKIV